MERADVPAKEVTEQPDTKAKEATKAKELLIISSRCSDKATEQPDDNARALEKREGLKLRWTAFLVLAWLLALSIGSIAGGLFSSRPSRP